jgi:hypothetical protein
MYKVSSHPSGTPQETHTYAPDEIRTGYIQYMIQGSHCVQVLGEKRFIQIV